MGSTKAPSPPAAPAPAPQVAAPDYGKAYREGIYADIETLPDRRKIEQAAQLGTKVTLDNGRVVDFTGLGDEALSTNAQRVAGITADMDAQQRLDQSRKYGADFINESLKQLELSDPEAFKGHKDLGKKVISDFMLGSKLSDEEIRDVEQGTRAAQTARGNILGDSAAVQEVMERSDAGNRRYQQRMQNLGSFLSGTPANAQFQSLSGAQQGGQPYNPTYTGGTNINPNSGANATNFALGVFGNQVQQRGQDMNYLASTYSSRLGFMSTVNGQPTEFERNFRLGLDTVGTIGSFAGGMAKM